MIRIKLTNEERNLELIGSVFCEQYQTEATFYIERSIPLKPGFGTGARHLVVQYGDGYTGREGLAVAATGQREFASMPMIGATKSCSNFYWLLRRTRMFRIRRGRFQHAYTEDRCCLTFEDTSGETVARAGRSSAL